MEDQPNPNIAPETSANSEIGGPELTNPWPNRFTRWGERLRAARLTGLVGALLDAAEPLGPIGAQLLWVAQPTLGLFVSHTEIDSLARWLEEPDGVARLRAHLCEPSGEPATGTEIYDH